MENNKRVKLGCYATNVSMSVVANLSPLLFITFNTKYGISFSLLGLLVLINFCTQLIIDLIFSFFSHKFNIPLVVKMTPLITLIGLFVYAIWPYIFSDHIYIGLVIGTVIFSASGGLSEVLISPVIDAIPSENPEHEMSKLHSIYAWGVVFVIIFSTLFLLAFGSDSWQILTLILMIVPLIGVVLFSTAKIPEMKKPDKTSGTLKYIKNKDLWLCVIAIFLGGAAECTMAQWCSGYLETALGIQKVWGDIFGVAIFGLTLGLGRTLYSKIGKNVSKVLFMGAIGAVLCYLIAAISPIPFIGLIACALTGFCVSMLWPGSLIVASERFPSGGVFIFAMMASGGDFGASVVPQLVGVIADMPAKIPALSTLASNLGMNPEQFGLRLGMLVGMLFPLIAIFVYLYIMKSLRFRKEDPDDSIPIDQLH